MVHSRRDTVNNTPFQAKQKGQLRPQIQEDPLKGQQPD